MSQAVPGHLLPHTVTLVRPAITTDTYGSNVYDYGVAATRTSVRAWMQQDQRTRLSTDGAIPLQQRWLLVTNHADVQRRDRVEWTSTAGPTVFELDGQPEPTYTPRGFHHTECSLIVVDG